MNASRVRASSKLSESETLSVQVTNDDTPVPIDHHMAKMSREADCRLDIAICLSLCLACSLNAVSR